MPRSPCASAGATAQKDGRRAQPNAAIMPAIRAIGMVAAGTEIALQLRLLAASRSVVGRNLECGSRNRRARTTRPRRLCPLIGTSTLWRAPVEMPKARQAPRQIIRRIAFAISPARLYRRIAQANPQSARAPLLSAPERSFCDHEMGLRGKKSRDWLQSRDDQLSRCGRLRSQTSPCDAGCSRRPGRRSLRGTR